MPGISDYIEGSIDLEVNEINEPETCTIRGLKEIIQTKSLKTLTYSMLNENYRWMR